MGSLLSFLFSFVLVAAAQGASLEDQIHQIVDKYHQTEAFHGNVEVRWQGQVLYKNSFGVANDSFDIPHNDRSRFMIASISKQFTAAAVLKLAEQGLVDIDAPYSQYVPLHEGHPDTLANWGSFTIRELLTHRAGLIRDVRPTDDYNPETYAPSLAAIVWDTTSEYNVFYKKKSKQGRYSNFGYLLMAYLVQKMSGSDFHDYMRRYLWAPLGMDSTGQYHRMFNIKYMVEGYNYLDGVGELRKRCCYDATSFVGSHSLYSDVQDLMIWMENLSARDPLVLSKESIDLMTTPHTSMLFHEASYGMGLFIDEVQGRKRIWHDGVESGFLSLVSTMPQLDLQIVILGNRHTSAVAYGQVYTRSMNDEIAELIASQNLTLKLSAVK